MHRSFCIFREVRLTHEEQNIRNAEYAAAGAYRQAYADADRAGAYAMVRQIESLDLSVLDVQESEEKRGTFALLFATTLSEIEKDRERYTQIGLQAIQNGKVGAVLLAGGQGSRLGFDHPKGMFRIGIERELYIFECLINNLLDVVKQADAWIPLFIMTSVENNRETQAFFEQHNYFGYSPDNVFFFIQEQLPTVDTNGKLMLADKGIIKTAPNGNGGWYASMAKTGMLQIVRDAQIEWLNVFAVDNVLQRIADPCFIGAVIESGKVSGAKVVAKAGPEEPNAYKFETQALNMVKMQDDCLAYEVDRSKEFAPVKNKTGVDSVDTARELRRLNGVEL